MSKGISNLEIENFFENEENQDLKNNYMGVHSIDSIARYIIFYEIKKKEMEIILLQFLILINTINQAGVDGVLWIFIQEKNLLLFDSLGLEGFKFFIVDNDEIFVYNIS